MSQAELLRTWALEAGFGKVGFCGTEGFDAAFQSVHAQPEIAERRQLRFFPGEELPWARSLAVLLWPYLPAAMPGGGEVFVDSYYFASNAAYHAARALESRLTEAGIRAQANVSYPAREAAVRAGLGVIGHSSLLITPEYGTRVVILLIATDIPAAGNASNQKGSCVRCGRCASACPSGAIDENGMSHPERCMRNFMMEGIVAPEPLREKMGMRLLGCDICQRVCPMQPKRGFEEGERFLLDAFVTADDQAFSQGIRRLAAVIGKNAARPQRVRAQAAILAGNRKDAADLPVLRAWMNSPFEAVAAHAAWAVGRIEASECGPGGEN